MHKMLPIQEKNERNPMKSIASHIDGIVAGDLVGWIANTEIPSSLEGITFTSESGKSLSAKSFLYRPDVCNAFGIKGKFGFAVPIRHLAVIGRRFQLTDRHGDPVGTGTVELPESDAAAGNGEDGSGSKAAFVFLHIQKCAGTSLRSAIQSNLPQSATVMIYPGGVPGLSLRELNALPLSQRQNFRLLIGHTYFGIGKYLGNTVRHLTFLRDPLARLKSNYWHHRWSGMTAFDFGGVSIPLSVVVNEGLSEEFDNLQTRMVAGTAAGDVPLGEMSEAELELALYNIDTAFDFVGLSERMEEDVARLGAVMGMPHLSVGRENVTPQKVMETDDPDYLKIDWNKVLQNNRIDQELYRQVVSRRNSGGRDVSA